LDIGGRTQVALRDHLRLAVDPRHLAQIPVRPPADHLLVQTCHTLGHTLFEPSGTADTPRNPRSDRVPRPHSPIRIRIARKLPLASSATPEPACCRLYSRRTPGGSARGSRGSSCP